MRKILLTQSQASIAFSSTLVVVFTLLLFLSGFVLQQRTVKSLHSSLQPRIPQRPPPTTSQQQAEQVEIAERLLKSRYFNRRGGRVALADLKRDVHEANAKIDWTRLAHIQLVTSHHEVCNAIMILADLQKMRSPARRVLLFPQSWAEEKQAAKGEPSDPYLDSTRRLMRMAARRYHIELRPIQPTFSAEESRELGERYSLASAFALHGEFDRVLSIETPGMLVEAEPLDAILAFTESTPFTMLHDTHDHDGVHSEDLLLLKPSLATYQEITERISQQPEYLTNASSFSSLFNDPLLLASSTEDSALVRAVSVLHDADETFNQTAYLSDVAYIRFWDPKLPGPEYDVPWTTRLAARPKNKVADWTWTNLYSQFAQKRVDVCGLDLETWRGEA